jgi:sugar/nucleoside kinase (ribokinase family)
MTVLSTIYQLRGPFPAPDHYQEITETFVIPGGEAGNGAIVLQNLGLNVTLDGGFLGDLTAEPIVQGLSARGIDCSRLHYRAGFPGWRDIVFCDGDSRTPFGWFIKYLFGGEPLWSAPSEEAIQSCRCVALDPFFGAESAQVAELCVKHGKDYVTIDCPWDSPIAQQARVIVCSQEFTNREYPDQSVESLMDQYESVCHGLVIFTLGSRPMLYASPMTPRAYMAPFQVPVVDTLGAGDTFRAGAVYALLQGLSDTEIVRFASACAAVACTRFPSVHEPPTLDEVMALIEAQGQK